MEGAQIVAAIFALVASLYWAARGDYSRATWWMVVALMNQLALTH